MGPCACQVGRGSTSEGMPGSLYQPCIPEGNTSKPPYVQMVCYKKRDYCDGCCPLSFSFSEQGLETGSASILVT